MTENLERSWSADLYPVVSKVPVDGGDVTLLSEEEKEELMASLEDVANDLNKKVDLKSSISKTAN